MKKMSLKRLDAHVDRMYSQTKNLMTGLDYWYMDIHGAKAWGFYNGNSDILVYFGGPKK